MVGIGIRLGLNKVSGGVYEKILETEQANLIGYWPLGEVPASQQYLTFNGSSTAINMGSDASLDDIPDGGEITIDLWVYIPNDVPNYGHVIGKADWADYGWYLYYVNDDLRFVVYGDSGSNGLLTDVSSYYDQWIHFTCHYDDATKTSRAAINGTWGSPNTAAGMGSYLSDAAQSLQIGKQPDAGIRYWKGSIGWVRVSDNDRFDAATPTNFSAPARTTIPTVDANTVGLWPMNEGYGSVAGDLSANDNDGTITDADWGAYPAADNAEGTAARDGTYIGATLGQAQSPYICPLFDGVNDYCHIGSSSFRTAFNGQLGTALIFGKVYDSGVWTDGVQRRFMTLQVDGANRVMLVKTGSQSLQYAYYAGGVNKSVQKSSMTETDWLCMALTWDFASDSAIAYYNGVQEGAEITGLGTFTGTLLATLTSVGADGISLSFPFSGWLAHAAVWTKALTAAQILAIYEAAGI